MKQALGVIVTIFLSVGSVWACKHKPTHVTNLAKPEPSAPSPSVWLLSRSYDPESGTFVLDDLTQRALHLESTSRQGLALGSSSVNPGALKLPAGVAGVATIDGRGQLFTRGGEHLAADAYAFAVDAKSRTLFVGPPELDLAVELKATEGWQIVSAGHLYLAGARLAHVDTDNRICQEGYVCLANFLRLTGQAFAAGRTESLGLGRVKSLASRPIELLFTKLNEDFSATHVRKASMSIPLVEGAFVALEKAKAAVNVVRKLGEGGEGSVYHIAVPGLQAKEVVAKVYRADPAPSRIELLQRDALNSNPYVARFYGKKTIELDGKPQMALIFEKGSEDVRSLINRGLTSEQLLTLNDNLFTGLQYMHLRGISHGDINARNIVSVQGQFKIIDTDGAATVTPPSSTKVQHDPNASITEEYAPFERLYNRYAKALGNDRKALAKAYEGYEAFMPDSLPDFWLRSDLHAAGWVSMEAWFKTNRAVIYKSVFGEPPDWNKLSTHTRLYNALVERKVFDEINHETQTSLGDFLKSAVSPFPASRPSLSDVNRFLEVLRLERPGLIAR